MSDVIHIILSGGVGSRLWPVSRKSMPKQYIPMFGEKSLFQLTAERNRLLTSKTVVIGNKDNYQLSRGDLLSAGILNYEEIVEAAPRNTAAAISFAALSTAPETILLVTPSDHIITNDEAYEQAINEAITLAKAGYLVTFGITPVKPETGYGYIEFDSTSVISFREKPDLKTAEGFLNSGNFLWNSGMFCFSAQTYLQELATFEPEIMRTSRHAFELAQDGVLPYSETMLIPSISVDYAVMERSSKIKVVKANFGWSDLGSFESIWDHWKGQGEDHRFVANNCVVNSSKHVEFLGVDNLILIETHDAILVLNKNDSQDVKKIYEKLEKEKPELIN